QPAEDRVEGGQLDLHLGDDGAEVPDDAVDLALVVGQESAEVVREVAQLGDGGVEDVCVLGEGLRDQHQVVEDGADLGVAVVDGTGDDVHVVDQATDLLVAGAQRLRHHRQVVNG